MLIGVAGGYIIVRASELFPAYEYLNGIRYDVKLFFVTYSIIKAAIFGLIITTISAFYGYYAKGNSLEVGRSSTKAVVVSSIVILIFNLILTHLLLT